MNPDFHLEMLDDVAVVRITRAAKRNALNDELILGLRHTFDNLPSSAKAAVLCGSGEHFCVTGLE